MPRPSTAERRRHELLPLVASAFAQTGYARATTADLARRCEVPENTLFRLWGDKKHMYLAALTYLYDRTVEVWHRRLADLPSGPSAAEQLLDYEGEHYGEHGLYRIIFTGLSELDDPDIRKALRGMYRRFHEFVAAQIAAHRADRGAAAPDANLLAWSVIGMATIAGIGRELRLVSKEQQRDLFTEVGRAVLELGAPAPSVTNNQTKEP